MTSGRQSGFSMYRPGAEGTAGKTAPDETSEDEPAEPAEEVNTVLGADEKVDLREDEASAKVQAVLDRLDGELVGLTAVKLRIREIAALLTVDRARARFGLSASKPSLHMSFTGAPGTGKTTVALRMAEILHALGYLRVPKVHAVTREDLVGQFIGHTAPKTKEAIAKAAGGVLFIDEAYYLFRPENERDYGQEAIEILLQEMESERGSLVVIFAGYEDRMETFFSANPGLSSRVAHHIEFEDYRKSELVAIAALMLDRDDYKFTPEAEAAFEEYLERRLALPRFANARSVRNALERTRLRQANRLVAAEGAVSRGDLILISEDDVRGSRVFDEAAEPDAEDRVRLS
ncbi:MAG: cbxXC [Pseudonocardiales bacterium]|nr:cbxXC [Pseudonocardiales bacterium]